MGKYRVEDAPEVLVIQVPRGLTKQVEIWMPEGGRVIGFVGNAARKIEALAADQSAVEYGVGPDDTEFGDPL